MWRLRTRAAATCVSKPHPEEPRACAASRRMAASDNLTTSWFETRPKTGAPHHEGWGYDNGGTATFDLTGPIGTDGLAYRFIASGISEDYWRNFGQTREMLIAPSLSWYGDATTVHLNYEHREFLYPFDRAASAIIEQAATQIFMTNPKARAVDYIEGFGLTPHEYEIVRTLPDDAVGARLNLTGEREILTILSGRERTVRLLDEIRAERGDDPADWIPRACPSLAPDSAFVSGVLGYVDCEAQALGLGGWQGMTGAGSANALILTGMLTIFIALIGYRILLGETPTLREGVVAIVKIGIVLALAT
eukprot:gene2771-3774_t